jgi:hypothetical protein
LDGIEFGSVNTLKGLSFRSAEFSREESAVSLPAVSRFLADKSGFGMTRAISAPQHPLRLVVSPAQSRYTDFPMSNPTQPNIKLTNTPDYRETYANSVQVRVNVWDFFLVFGTLQQQSETQVEVNNFQGIYLSPQQAKALSGILQQNVAGYESTFGEIKLDPRMMAPGPVH